MLGIWSFLFLGLCVGLVIIVDGWVTLGHMAIGAALYALFHDYRTWQEAIELRKKIERLEKEVKKENEEENETDARS